VTESEGQFEEQIVELATLIRQSRYLVAFSGDAEPNEGHRAPARLYQAGRLKTMITQNIDSV
jgi:NAD-dependent SIR2 family protein deacetylase